MIYSGGPDYYYTVYFENGKYTLENYTGIFDTPERMDITEEDATAIKAIFDKVTDTESEKLAYRELNPYIMKYKVIEHRRKRGLPPPDKK